MHFFYNCCCGPSNPVAAYSTCGQCNPFTSHVCCRSFRVCEPCNTNGCCMVRRCTSVGACGFSGTGANCGMCGAGSCRYFGPQFGQFTTCGSCSAGKPCSSFGSSGCCTPCQPCASCAPSHCAANGRCFANVPCRLSDHCMPGGTCRPCEHCNPYERCNPLGPCQPFGLGKPFNPANLIAPCKPCDSRDSCNLCNPSAKCSSCGPCRPCTPWAPCASCAPASCCTQPKRTFRVPNYTQEYLAAIRRYYSSTAKRVRVRKVKTPKKVTSKFALTRGTVAAS